METTVFCGNCGTPMTADKQFCTACGSPLNAVQPQPAAQVAFDPPHTYHQARPAHSRESFVNDLRDMGGKELAGLSFGAFAGASTGFFGGKEAVRTMFGLLRFWIFLFMVWLLFLFGVVPALMDGNWLPLVVWVIAGTPVWLTGVFALNHASTRIGLLCFSLCCIVSIASIAAYCKLRYDQGAFRPAQLQPPSPAQPARRPARTRHNLSRSGQRSNSYNSNTQGANPAPLRAPEQLESAQ